MNQIKIGMFIAELRKEKGMTQKQLAESIGVSDKTVSKWECGNGLPEMSSIPVLCDALAINMNELLSGERLEEAAYPAKAEENMMTLMKETEVQKRKSRASTVILILCLVGAMVIVTLALSIGIGFSNFVSFFDPVTLLMVVIPVLLILAAAGFLKSFFQAFCILGRGRQYTELQRKRAKLALKLGANAFLTIGGMESLATIILLLPSYGKALALEQLLANIAIASLGILYGIIAFALLLPVRYKLVAEMEEHI